MTKRNKVSGKRSGPPPKRGPNPNFPIKLRYGGDTMGGPNDKSKKGPGADFSKVSAVQQANHVAAMNKNMANNTTSQNNLKNNFTVGAKPINNAVLNKAMNLNIAGVNTAKQLVEPIAVSKNVSIPPIGKFGIAVKVLTGIENQRRAKRAKGEFFTSKKKLMPANRDFYRQYGRPLQTKLTPGKKGIDDDYLRAAKIIGTHKAPPYTGNDRPKLCPDGISYPPCPVQPVVSASTGKAIKVRGTRKAIQGTKFKGVF
jgi:hypothetical protein